MTFSDEEIKAAASHLNYEVKAMAELFAWTCRLEETGPAVLKNACLEATLIHVRLLIEFVAGRRKDPDDPRRRRWSPKDIKPEHLVPNWPGLPDGRLDIYLELADQYVAHLSLVRAQTIAARGWSLERMVDASSSSSSASPRWSKDPGVLPARSYELACVRPLSSRQGRTRPGRQRILADTAARPRASSSCHARKTAR